MDKNNEGTTAKNYFVVVGEVNLNAQDPTQEVISVRTLTVHPQFNPSLAIYDYAILNLNRSLDFTGKEKHLMPVCLPTLNQSFDGQTCTASGWGYTKDIPDGGKAPNPELLKVDLAIVPFEECKEDYKRVIPVDRNVMICAGPEEGGKAICRGDSGGPLQCPRSDGRYVLAGITSWIVRCGAPHNPSVFAQVSTQLDWIQMEAGPTP
ncbi:hypothetical protein ISCGN_010168 [Ixodes scapularis]